MRTAVVIFLVFLGLLAIVEFSFAQDSESNCDTWECSSECYDGGLHGQCDHDNVCRCYNCIYRACRKFCLRQNRVGQCDGGNCRCL